MLPTLSFDRRNVTPGVENVVHVMLELAAPRAPERIGPPLDLVVVLDGAHRPGSDALTATAAAATEVLRVVRPDDRLGVVAIDREATVVLPLGHHDPEFVVRAIRVVPSGVGDLSSRGRATAEGLLEAAPRDGAEQRIVVITDSSPATHLAGLVGATVVAHDVSLSVELAAVVTAATVLDDQPVAVDRQRVELDLGDVYGGEARRFVLRLAVMPPVPTAATDDSPLELGLVTVRWRHGRPQGPVHTVGLPITVHVGGEAGMSW